MTLSEQHRNFHMLRSGRGSAPVEAACNAQVDDADQVGALVDVRQRQVRDVPLTWPGACALASDNTANTHAAQHASLVLVRMSASFDPTVRYKEAVPCHPYNDTNPQCALWALGAGGDPGVYI